MHDPREHFALASHHVAMAVGRVAAQRVRAFDSRYLGIRTPDAEILLYLMEETLELMLAHYRTLQAKMIEWQKRHPGAVEQQSPESVSTSPSFPETNAVAA
jgi:hypothetical protein